MQLTQWNPFREMDEVLRTFRFPREAAGPLADFTPAVDISERDKEYLVKAQLPGVKKDEVKVEFMNGVLTLSGERRFDKEDKDEKTHRIESAFGAFTRSFVVPEDVLTEKIAADYKDGILFVHLPKTDIKKPATKAIKVN
ncbi:MAG: Hsp20/alpha crystallin family protein [Gammaproteobacteria bacterium]